jgi:hypothetical protein
MAPNVWRFRPTSIAAALCLTAAACGDPVPTGTTEPSVQVPASLSHEDYRDRIVALGFRADMIVEHETFFVVEEDIVLAKTFLATLPSRAEGGGRFSLDPLQWRTFNTVSAPQWNRLDITQISGNAAWHSAAQQAAAEWNLLSGSRVRVSTEPCPNCGNRTVVSFYNEACTDNGCTLARASWPAANGRPGPTIEINLSFNVGLGPNGQPTAAAKLNTLVHEIGHTVGFRHTNWQTNDCQFPPCQPGAIGAVLIPGTPEQDAASVMQGNTANRDWAGFSYWDRASARVLYKGYGPFNQGGTVENGHPRISWTPATDALYYNVYYSPEGHCESWDENGMTIIQCYPSSTSILVASTTDSFFVDTSRNAVGVRPCSAQMEHYRVSTVFPVAGETIRTAEWGAHGACFY